jgi:hypothetical protein
MNINPSSIFIWYIVLSFIITFILKLLSNKKITDEPANVTIALIGFFWFLIIPSYVIFIVLYFILRIPFLLADLITRNK